MDQSFFHGSEALVLWDSGSEGFGDRLARVQSAPRFAEAARTLAAAMQAVVDHDGALDGVFKDGGRYLAASWAFNLSATDDLTLARLKLMCIESGFVSPGRARAILNYLCHLGYVAPVECAPLRYRATPVFVAAWRRHARAALSAAMVVEPAVLGVLEAVSDDDVLFRFTKIHSDGLLELARGIGPDLGVAGVFMHRHAGSQIIWSLVTAAEAEVFPPPVVRPAPMAVMARRFRVSRIHIRRMFEGARLAGLLRTPGDGTMIFEERGRVEIATLFAAQLCELIVAAARTARTLAIPSPTP